MVVNGSKWFAIDLTGGQQVAAMVARSTSGCKWSANGRKGQQVVASGQQVVSKCLNARKWSTSGQQWSQVVASGQQSGQQEVASGRTWKQTESKRSTSGQQVVVNGRKWKQMKASGQQMVNKWS